jgi:hypothetical protein
MLLCADLETWVNRYDEGKTHSGKYRFGKTAGENIYGFNAAG